MTESFDKPFVTIQLPVYNEKYVIKRLLSSCRESRLPERIGWRFRFWMIAQTIRRF